MHDNLDDEQKEHLKIEDNKRKKTKHDNLDDNKREQFRKYKKKRKRKLYVITLMMSKKNI